jgi:superfamily I DNA and/or RNA helicase
MIAQLIWRLEQAAMAGNFKIKGMVVTFYAAQRRLVRQSIQKIQSQFGGFKHSTWAVDTVERHQGKEADVVLVSMTRNPGRGGITAKGNMAQCERVNVALSRAKSLLVIFGARSALEDYPVMMDTMDDQALAQTVCVYGKIIEDIQRMGGFVTQSAFLEAMGEIA